MPITALMTLVLTNTSGSPVIEPVQDQKTNRVQDLQSSEFIPAVASFRSRSQPTTKSLDTLI